MLHEEADLDPTSAVERALEEYLEQVDAGTTPDLDEFFKAHADYADELRECLQTEQYVQVLAETNPEFPEAASSVNAYEKTKPFQNGPGAGISRILGDYILLQQIGRGGMGVVYKARQLGLDRVVAVKVIADGQFANPIAVRRFRSEAKLASKLNHSQIVSIHQIGEEQGLLYYSMDYIPGQTLAEVLHEGPLPPRRACEIVMQTARVMAYTHQQGLLHRDLKPANILLDESKRPLITDFGLARSFDDESQVTRTGEIVGTVSYISPEQASGDTAKSELGPESDIYSLGAILYALLVGRPPFQSDSSLDTLLQVRYQEPISPRRFNKKIPPELETICLKCLEKSPQQRYQTADELEEDLARFLSSEPILAKPNRWWKRGWRWCLRHRSAALGLGGVAVLLGVLVIGLVLHSVMVNSLNGRLARSNNELTHIRNDLNTALGQSESRKQRLEQSLYVANMQAASRAYNEQDLREVQRVLALSVPKPGERDLRGYEWKLLQEIVTAPYTQLSGHVGDVYAAKYSPDGRWLASAGEDGTVRFYRVPSLQLDHVIPGSLRPMRGLEFHPTSESVACCCKDGNVYIYDVETGKLLQTIPAHPGLVCDATWTADGTLLTCGDEPWIRLWDATTTQPLGKIGPNPGDRIITRLALSHNDQWLAAAQGAHMTVWDRTTNTQRMSFTVPSRVTSVAFSPNDDWVAFGSLESKTRLLPCKDRTNPTTYESSHRDPVEAVAFSPDGRWGADTDRGGLLSLWPIDTGKPGSNRVPLSPTTETLSTQTLAHQTEVISIEFSPDSRQIVTSSQDGLVRVWNVAELLPQRFTQVQGEQIDDVIPMSDGTLLLWVFGDILHYDPATGELRSVVEPKKIEWQNTPKHEQALAVLHFDAGVRSTSPERFQRNPCLLWRDALSPELGKLHSVCVSADGTMLAGLTAKWQLALLNAKTYAPSEDCPLIRCNSLAFSPVDSGILAVSLVGLDNVELWDIETARRTKILGYHSAQVNSLAFSPDGRYLASGAEDRRIKVWEVSTGKLVRTFHGHRGRITDVIFSPDGSSLLSTGWDDTLRVWSMTLQEEMLTLGTPKQPKVGTYQLRISANGRYLVQRSNTIFTRYKLPTMDTAD
ncbi:WD40 repeat domain-containing serine/threonine protein kinase [Thalassoroseus pseudoceratinae]|uniref:WD40 repeat domain-containing serine/threonine protein kinase n=1 Tax=Thalassoroseus pseudoceratinae TaxID=2713176 RepID=UPI0014243400|nr:serine/threonine-protein kinase [Thalassoroseus pseudoceratinae]